MTIPDLDQKLEELASEYYRIVGADHHKDRDCHFYITLKISYGAILGFCIEHDGYLNSFFRGTYRSLEDAKKALILELQHLIEKEKRTDVQDNS